MLFDNAETRRAVAAIAMGAQKWTKAELAAVLELAKSRKPPELDRVSVDAQKRYRGRQREVVQTALRKRFPNTVGMPVAAINWLRVFARGDAGVYVVTPDRWLDGPDGKRLPPDDKRAILWAEQLKLSRFNAVMAECERRALIPPGSVFGQIVWITAPGAKIGRPRIDLYWIHDVEMLCHWQAPTSSEFAYMVATRQASPDVKSRGEWYRVWSRMPPPLMDGSWGKWHSVLISTEGEQAAEDAAPVPYDGEVLPGFLLQLSDPEGYPFVLEDVDLIDVVDDLNERRSNESFVIGLQGHNQLWTDSQQDNADLKVGPDAMMKVLPGATVGVISPQPLLTDMRESRKLSLREVAISRGNAPDAYATEPGPPLSGVAKRIANLAHDVRVAEQASLMQVAEEEGPLRVLLDVVRTFHPDGALLDGCTPRMAPRKLPTFEDPVQRQTRLAEAVKLEWITDARGAADAELYGSVEEAKAAIEGIKAAKAPAVATPVPTPPAPTDAAQGDPATMAPTVKP